MSATDAAVTLVEITGETLGPILKLQVSEDQRQFVDPNSVSIAQAHFEERAWFRAIYAGDEPVGFVMLYLDDEQSRYMVWRMMIGEPFHGRGFGRRAMEAVIEHVRANHPNAEELTLSYGQGPGSPEGFYKKLGFIPTGKEEFGEVYASLSLK